MSRSYNKVPPRKCSDYINKRDVRACDSSSIHQEMANPEYGDAVFLSEKKRSSPWRSFRRYRSISEILNGYFLEIRNIHNSHIERYLSWDEAFIEVYNYFRGCLSDDVRIFHFEWLMPKKTRAVIKSWQGRWA